MLCLSFFLTKIQFSICILNYSTVFNYRDSLHLHIQFLKNNFMDKNIVKTYWKGDMTFDATNPGGNLVMDASKEIGGNDDGLRPKAMMLASLAGCSGIDIAMLLKKMKVEIDTFDIEIEAELTDEHPRFYHKVDCVYNFYGTDLNEKKIQKIVDLSVDKYCGVMEMFRQFAEVTIAIKYHNS